MDCTPSARGAKVAASLLFTPTTESHEHAAPRSHQGVSRRDDRVAAGPACAPGARLRGAPHLRVRGAQARGVRLHRASQGRQDRRGRRAADGQRPGHRPARRHGRAADRGGHRPALQVEARGQDARLRPRRAHNDAAGRGPLPGRDAQLRRHRAFHLPAGRGGSGRRQSHARRQAVRALPLRQRLRHAQHAGAGARQVRDPAGSDDGRRRVLRHHRHGPRLARRPARSPASIPCLPPATSRRRCRRSWRATSARPTPLWSA